MTSIVCAIARSSSTSGARCAARHPRERETEDEREEHQRDHGVAGGRRDRVRRQQVGELVGQPGDGRSGAAVMREQGVRAHRAARPQRINRGRDEGRCGRYRREQRDEQPERERSSPGRLLRRCLHP